MLWLIPKCMTTLHEYINTRGKWRVWKKIAVTAVAKTGSWLVLKQCMGVIDMFYKTIDQF